MVSDSGKTTCLGLCVCVCIYVYMKEDDQEKDSYSNKMFHGSNRYDLVFSFPFPFFPFRNLYTIEDIIFLIPNASSLKSALQAEYMAKSEINPNGTVWFEVPGGSLGGLSVVLV